MFVLSFICVIFFDFGLLAHASPVEQLVFDLNALKPYDGKQIHAIRVHGLKWTREQAVRWLLSLHEGDRFDSARWIKGIHKLYDTTVIYNVTTNIHPYSEPARSDQDLIDIDLEVTDRWTLLPFGNFQTGGGSDSWGGGVFDANVLGYFGQLSGSYNVFNGISSYDLNYFQEFFRDTDYIMGLDISRTGLPVDLQQQNGQDIGSYIWVRQQEQLLFGKKLPEYNIRLYSYFEYFRDTIPTNEGATEASVYTVGQYRIRPVLIQGRSELTNFLEQGHELTFAPTTANFFSGHYQYHQLVMTYKRTYIDKNTNYAMFFNVGAMTPAPVPYLFHLGGFDTVRGFSTYRALGRYYFNNNLEYRPYLLRMPLPWIGDMVVQGCVFQDIGQMWEAHDLAASQNVNSSLFLLSEGVGLRFNFQSFASAIGRIDAARTITPNEGWGISIGVGQFF